MSGICGNCRRAPVVARGRCRACYLYRWRRGEERPAQLYDRQPRPQPVPEPELSPAEVEADLRAYAAGVRERHAAGEAEPWLLTQPCGFCDRPIPAGGMGYCHECEMEMGA